MSSSSKAQLCSTLNPKPIYIHIYVYIYICIYIYIYASQALHPKKTKHTFLLGQIMELIVG